MNWFDRLAAKFRRFAIPGLTSYIAGLQAALWGLSLVTPLPQRPQLLESFLLIPEKVLDGEVWRLMSFVFLPPGDGLLTIFGIYLFYLMGQALEGFWGTFRYNLFIAVAVLATIVAAFCLPQMNTATNVFIGSSVFLAFAYLYPDFTISIYFILPIRIKWLALLTWLGYALVVITGDWRMRAYVLASICNFLLFFGRDIFQRMVSRKRLMKSDFRHAAEHAKPFHTCVVCGLTDHDEPHEDFRICSQCTAGPFEYCSQHLRNHEHRIGDAIVK